ncbi:hypothetical protein M8S83_08275 [Enterobacter asburiae]|uniref:hypothetical protein n=1 Tax=Enterobacter cloacae complex TaxID=354276 RepID=UPI00107EE580|nr:MULTISPECIES: hypothetical protein [Enterobacter cloacae complex]MCM7772105.1 hypothetical protein [Enterobacter asburiae]QBX86468.1 hypothetical protein E4005_18030 [Enterobacter roggenkampii]
MDILNLLEVLKPASHIVTVKMESNSNFWDSVSKTLIALLPAFISFLALFFSYYQFKSNMRNQSEMFALGVQQQLKTLKLNTRLATEIELKKDICKEVRAAFVGFMKHHTELYHAKREYLSLEDKFDQYSNERRTISHEIIIDKGQLIIESRMLLDSYLDLSDPHDRKFFEILNDVTEVALKGGDGTGADLGYLQGRCSTVCFEYIEKRRKEITGLVDTIGD